jgi:hypothetical protein
MIDTVGYFAKRSSRRFEARREHAADGGIAAAMSPVGGNMYGKDIHEISVAIEMSSLKPEGRVASWLRAT